MSIIQRKYIPPIAFVIDGMFRMIAYNNLYKYYISCRKQNVLNAMYYIALNVTM